MAANDPSFDVATPRGVLQGVAVHTWDGTNWQPSGKAATEVATPTGILRGVAAFSGGPNWSPNTRAQTEVPTPSGVLDGVAVYTWSGTAWVPPSGNIEVATPSGVLEGVAAFDWDGANWQPQAQAGAEVPTSYGVLTGVARFAWTGSAWAAVGAPSLSLDFMTPGTLDSRIVFTRASTATYTDASGVIQTAAVNVPRWDYDLVTHALRGLLIEEARTNLLLNSATLGTQSVAVTAQAYTLSFYGTGTVTKSGAATGALVGTGAGQRVTQTFTPTAGAVTCTVTGSVTNAQIEAGGWASSWISTAGASATRAADQCSLPVGAWFSATQGSLFYEYILEGVLPNYNAPMAFVGTGSNAIEVEEYAPIGGATATMAVANGCELFLTGGGTAAAANFAAGIPVPAGTVARAASAWMLGAPLSVAHGGVINTTNSGAAASLPTVSSLSIPVSVVGLPIVSQWARRVLYWPRQLSPSELQQVTT